MGRNTFTALAIAATALGFASVASAAPFGQPSSVAESKVSGSAHPVDWRPYRHCHWEDGKRWCHGGELPYGSPYWRYHHGHHGHNGHHGDHGHDGHHGSQGHNGHHGGGGPGAAASDIRLKKDIVLLTRLDNGIGLYRYRYKWSDQLYVGVMAQEVENIIPTAVTHGRDGYLRVNYGQLGLQLMTWHQWVARQ